MTQEEKAKRYDEAIEIAKEFKNNPFAGYDGTDLISALFPELKESEDERVRKVIILCLEECVHSDVIRDYEKDNALAWLEKQGTPAKLSEEEQNKFAKGVLTSCAMSFIDYLDAHKYEGKMCVSNGECEDIENTFHNAMWDRLHRYYCKYIEKQGEQKPYGQRQECSNCQFNYAGECKGSCAMKIGEQKSADKVEPKFHEGEWVVSPNGVYWHIDAIQDGRYQVSSDSGKRTDWPLDTNIYHRFTLQDAKNGDVLISKYGIPFIYNGNLDSFNIGSYCGITTEGMFNVATEKCHWTENVNIHPANKEQRDLLFQKMKEAGYEWDVEKKELRKIEHKSAWSEEDEDYYDAIIVKLEVTQDDAGLTDNQMDFLKSLKDRVQPLKQTIKE